jgi:hypothetical protein
MSCVNIYAQNPFCTLKSSPVVENTMTTKKNQNEREKTYRSAHFVEEGCGFRFRLQDPVGNGWSSKNGIQITVDDVDYGIVTLPWGGGGYAEVFRILPSGEVQFIWIGEFYYPAHCFEIYNSADSLIYKSGTPIPDPLFLIYQNECPIDEECLPVTDLEGVHIQEIKQVELTWKAPNSTYFTGFEIYRNEELIAQAPPATVSYSDNTEALEPGNYKYCVIPVYPFECDDLEETCVTIPIGVGINNFKDNIFIFPNPANDVVNILGIDVVNVKVFNNIGQIVLTQNNSNIINVSGLTNGIYLLSIETSTGCIIHNKIIINH